MQLTDNQKKRFLEYVERRKNASGEQKIEYALNLEDLYQNMVKDLIKKTGRIQSSQQFGDYIFANAVENMENSLSETDKNLIKKDQDQSEKMNILIDLLAEPKYNNHFITGLAFGYAKLAYRLKVEPEVAYVGVVETLSTITN